MKFIQRIFAGIIFFLFLSPVIAQTPETKEDVKAPAEQVGKAERIVILPFYDYTGSSMKYLSSYIPELIRDRLGEVEGLEIFDARMIQNEIELQNLTPEKIYDRETQLQFLKSVGATIGLSGRYVIIGNTMRINYRILYAKSGKMVRATPYEGVVDDNLLDTVERFADASADWFSIQALSEIVTKIEAKRKTRFSELMKRIEESQVGIIIRNKWLFSLFILVSFYVLSRLIVLFFEKVLRRFARKSETTVDDELISVSKKPIKWIIIFLGLKLALLPLKLSATTALFFSNLTTALIIAGITFIIYKSLGILIQFWGRRVADRIDSRIDDDLVPLFVKITNIFIIIMGALLILSKFGVEIGPLVASLGIAGFAIGFAVKDSLSNIIGGIILILDKSLAVGDKVTIDDDTGIIKEVGLRNTKLQTYDNEIIVIPNGDLMNKKFKNYVLPDPTIRVVVDFGVAYGTNGYRSMRISMARRWKRQRRSTMRSLRITSIFPFQLKPCTWRGNRSDEIESGCVGAVVGH
jgi:small-conductance mechanosensitive channel/TolB-like protein